jgi:diguanylate cyclase (GGDEF)-like protein
MRVSCLRSGRDLLKFMGKNAPDLILLDIQMPEMDGFTTQQELRRMEEEAGREPTPIIFLSGLETSEAESRSFEQGAADFIRKPVHKDILTKRILNTVKHTKEIVSLKEEAAVDKLTGLLNKAAGTVRVTKLCAERAGMLMILDLDNFKLVNDIYGHSMGDKVLRTFADVVRRNIRSQDVMVRIGGDEFLGFFTNMESETALESLHRRLNSELIKETVKLAGESFNIPLSISIGAVLVPEYGQDYDMLFPLADSALYKVKQSGKNGVRIYGQDGENNLFDENDIQKEFTHITQIVESWHRRDGVISMDLKQFSLLYHFLRQFYKRYGGMVVKLLFILSEEKTAEVRPDSLKEAAEKFELCLQDTLRKSDMILRYKPNQFYVLLQNLSEEDFQTVFQRIMDTWKAGENRTGIHIEYLMEYVTYEKENYNR